MKHEITEKYITGYNHFRNNLCGYHGITDFFKDGSYIKYESDDYVFVYENKHLTIQHKNHEGYKMPKIMYVPAERNMMVAIEHAEKVRRLPSNLQTMQSEYLKALKSLKGKVALPVRDVYLQYDRLNKVTWIMGDDYRVRAENSASGYQSVTPLVGFCSLPIADWHGSRCQAHDYYFDNIEMAAIRYLLQVLAFALMWYPIHAINLSLLQVKGRSDLFLRL